MSPAWSTFLFEAANFLLLAAVLGWLFFRPVREALERRRSELEADRSRAAADRAEAERGLQAIQGRRAELEASLEEIRARVQREAESERDRLLEEVRSRMQRERDSLKEELVSLRRAQARALARDAAFAAREIVVRLLEAMAGPDLERALQGVAKRELAALRADGSLAPLVIESAGELDEETLGSLAEAAGVPRDQARHRVDPDRVAGLRVVTARGLVDVSVAGLAAQAERALVSRIEQENGSRG